MKAPNPMLTLPSFKPWNWKDKDTNAVKPLLEKGSLEVEDIPWVGLGIEYPELFEFYNKQEINFDNFFDRAVRNLGMIKVSRALISRRYRIMQVYNSYFACEKILDQNFMKSLHEELKTDLLLVGLPRKGEMLVTDFSKPGNAKKLRTLVEARYAEELKRPALTKTLFLIKNGKILGIALDHVMALGDREKKSFFSRLVGVLF